MAVGLSVRAPLAHLEEGSKHPFTLLDQEEDLDSRVLVFSESSPQSLVSSAVGYVGNVPSMHFETDDTPTPALALGLYRAIAQVWAENVLAGSDLSDSYPIEAAPTQEHAEMLLSRIEFIRTKLVPLAVSPPSLRSEEGLQIAKNEVPEPVGA